MTNASWAVIIAGGKDEMLNPDTCTAFLNLHNKPILSYSLTAFEHCPEIEGVVVVAPRDRLEQVLSVIQLFGCHKVRKIVPSGPTQYSSLVAGLKYVDDNARTIVVHEASRPGLSAADVSEQIKLARKHELVLAGRELTEQAVLVGKNAVVEQHLEAGTVWKYGSPLAVSAEVLRKAIATVAKKKKNVKTVLEALQVFGTVPRLSKSSRFPLKISNFDQLREFEQIAAPA